MRLSKADLCDCGFTTSSPTSFPPVLPWVAAVSMEARARWACGGLDLGVAEQLADRGRLSLSASARLTKLWRVSSSPARLRMQRRGQSVKREPESLTAMTQGLSG